MPGLCAITIIAAPTETKNSVHAVLVPQRVTSTRLKPQPTPISCPRRELKQLGYKIAQEPEYLKKFLIQLFEDVDKVTDDPFTTMLLYSRLLQQLTPIIGNNMFTAELNDFLQRLPPSRRASFQTFIWKYAILRNPLSRLTLLRGIVNRISKKTIDGKTIDGTIPDPRFP